MTIQYNINLRDYTTFKIGGTARYFSIVQNETEAADCLRWANEKALHVLIMGGGSNILVPDSMFDGLILLTKFHTLTFTKNNANCGASITLEKLLTEAYKNNFTGLEFTAGIPGTLGGAIRGNAGTFGVNMDSVVESVQYINAKNFKYESLKKADCDFGYRHSLFKKEPHLITGATLILKSGNVAASQALVSQRIDTRLSTHPVLPSAGCIFKNIPYSSAVIKRLKPDDIRMTKFKEFGKIPAGFVIEQAGLKGKQIGGAQVSEQHANYIVNCNDKATYDDVITLISYIKQQIRDTYGIQLQEEIQVIN